MPQPSEVKPANTVFKDNSGGDNTVYVSPNHSLTARKGTSVRGGTDKVNYVVVVDPKTKTQAVYERDFVNGFAQPIDPAKKIAEKGPDGQFVPTDYAANNLPPKIVKRLNESETTQATLNNVVDYTVKSSLQQTSPDGKASPTDVAEVLNQPVQPNDPENPTNPAGADIEPGDGSLGATTVTSADQDKVSNFSTDLDLVYPVGANGGESDYIKFTALKYLPSKLSTASGTFGTVYQQGTSEGIGQSVQLPIQGGIQDSNAVGWNEDTMNVMQAAGAEIAKEGIGKGIGAGVNTFIKQAKTLAENSPAVKTAIANEMAGQAVGSNIMARTERAILNPNTELLFQGPQLRAFSFNFKMTPRSKAEGEVVKSIIKFFKFHMAPKLTDAQLFLKAPNIFRIEYFAKGQQHTGINLIKDCALQACTVDYTPDGTYMSYEDGAMFSYDLQLQFMELIPIYAKDYNEGDNSNHPIGY